MAELDHAPERRISVYVTPCEIAVMFGDLPHLLLKRASVVGVQAYIKNVGVREPVYFIEFSTSEGLIVADYDKRPVWEHVLRELRDAKVFDHMQGAAPLPGSA